MLGLSLVAAVATGFGVYLSFPDVGSFPRASGENVPVELTAGEWTVFAENGGGPPVAIEDPDGQPVNVGFTTASQTYDLRGRSGRSVGEIDAPTDGTYLVTTQPGQTVAFGQGFLGALFRTIAVALIGGLLTVILFVVGLVLALRKR